MMKSINLPPFVFTVIAGVFLFFFGWKRATLYTVLTIMACRWHKIYITIKMLPRDLRTVYFILKLTYKMKRFEKNNMTLVDAFRQQLRKFPDRACFIFENTVWTFQEVEDLSNKVANVFFSAGYKKEDVVALMMTNRPEYVCVWLGLAKLGIVISLLNTNLRDMSLIHCIKTANCKAVLFSKDLAPVVLDVCKDMPLYQFDGESNMPSVECLEPLIKKSTTWPPPVTDSFGYTDKLLNIYTSGTTGLPKAAVLPNSRYILATMGMHCLCNLQEGDIIYNPLPLYHTAGGALGAGVALTSGIPVVLRTKFSASSYIPDCIKYNCTIGQYIGEMCRYILAVPPAIEDKQHMLRCMIGNGLRPAIWETFIERFNIHNILEVYGATEGNVNIANLDNKVGAVGSLPQFMPEFLYPLGIIRMDPESMEPLRTVDGLCVRSEPGEPGMFVGLIKTNDPTREFHGYVNKSESRKKIIHNVFSEGDSAFVSGDIMVVDEFGYIYFKDRTGDTFRWKGENVATSEVEAVVSSVAGLRDCTVYGVQVGDFEGKAGMASVVDPDNSLDLSSLALALDRALPYYARPLFLRILGSIEMTGTFKLKKLQLQKEGFDPQLVKDKIYFRNSTDFVPLTKDLYVSILEGKIKL